MFIIGNVGGNFYLSGDYLCISLRLSFSSVLPYHLFACFHVICDVFFKLRSPFYQCRLQDCIAIFTVQLLLHGSMLTLNHNVTTLVSMLDL
jgi:hypothetical protein